MQPYKSTRHAQKKEATEIETVEVKVKEDQALVAVM